MRRVKRRRSTRADAAATSRLREARPTPLTEHEQDIVVTGVRRKENDVLGGVSVLDEADLTRQVRSSIGETLARQPGVSATSFGPTASAPVLRGLSGDRVRVLTDGIGTLDLSSSGPDHAVSINPITASGSRFSGGPRLCCSGRRPSAASSNVIDTRIPRHQPNGPVAVDGLLSYWQRCQRTIGQSRHRPAPGRPFRRPRRRKLVEERRSQDWRPYPVEGSAAGRRWPARSRHQRTGRPEGRAAQFGANRRRALGFGYVDGEPQRRRFGHAPLANMRCRSAIRSTRRRAGSADHRRRADRYDARAEIPVGGFFSQVRARGGYRNYHHDELEADGAIGSSFFSKGGEGRLELVQADHRGWGGTSGVQYLERNAQIRGEEKFLPDSRQKQTGLFTLQTYVDGPVRIEGGARVEFSKLNADEDDQLGTPERSRNFTTLSGSLGGQYEFVRGWRAGLSLSHSERAPAIDELFANGPHGGSQAFEVGNPDLDPERSNSIELGLHHSKGRLHLTANLFYSRFSNFIFQAPTGEVEDNLPVLEYRQGKATYYGFEAQAEMKFGEALGIDWGGELQGDAVHATVKDFGPAPLIPPMRLLGALTGAKGQFDGRLEVEQAFDHSRTAPNESDTAGYTIVNASIDWHPFAAKPELTLSLAGNNLFDVEARRSTSIAQGFRAAGRPRHSPDGPGGFLGPGLREGSGLAITRAHDPDPARRGAAVASPGSCGGSRAQAG
jgi:iron complex outermembrane receptor protein